MSWQQYVDTNLLGTGKVTQAAIYGMAMYSYRSHCLGADGTLWATSKGFQVSAKIVCLIVS